MDGVGWQLAGEGALWEEQGAGEHRHQHLHLVVLVSVQGVKVVVVQGVKVVVVQVVVAVQVVVVVQVVVSPHTILPSILLLCLDSELLCSNPRPVGN